MWRLPAPSRTAQWTYDRCVDGVKNPALRGRFEEVAGDIAAAASSFETAVTSGTVTSYPTATAVGSVTAGEMTWLYENRLVRSTSPGRLVYDEIMAAAINRRCPMCGHRQVASLDHYLPKALFPGLSVSPSNLVPACSDCNRQKLGSRPVISAEVLIHPYFDNVEDQGWLVAQIESTSPASVHFYVDPPTEWPPGLGARVSHQFEMLRLASLYASQAAEEIVNIRGSLAAVHSAGGPSEVAAFLAQAASSRRAANVNSWQTAMYSATAASSWFCSGGFG